MKNKTRCKWCNLQNPLYIKYHDEEWCRPNFEEKYLFEMLILESFQAGLSWECVLNKREDFKKAYDEFDINKICCYDNSKIQELLSNKKIIRNKLKINASINNSRIFKNIQNEYGTFYNYLKSFSKDIVIYETNKTTSELSDKWYQPIGEFYYKNTIHRFEYLYIASTGLVIDKHRNKEMITKHGIKQFRKITEWYIFPNGKMELCRKNEEHNLIHFGKPIYVISVKKWNQVKSQDEKSNVK